MPCCFSLGENLDFVQKKCFKTSTTIEQKTQLFFVQKKLKAELNENSFFAVAAK